MGYAIGELYGTEIAANVKGFALYGRTKVASILSPWGVPDFVIDRIFKRALALFESLLDWNYNTALPYIP